MNREIEAKNQKMENTNSENVNRVSATNADAQPKPRKKWTIVSALDRVLRRAKNSQLSDEFWVNAERPLAFLRKKLKLTNVQIVFMALLAEREQPVTWQKLGQFLNCSRLSVMAHAEELYDLQAKRWVERRVAKDECGKQEGFILAPGVVSAFSHNMAFEPEKIDGLNIQQFMEILERHLSKTLSNYSIDFADDENWMQQLLEANPQLPICQRLKPLENIHDKSLFLLILLQYARDGGDKNVGFNLGAVDNYYPDDFGTDMMQVELMDDTHILFEENLIEHKCEDGIANNECYVLTDEVINELLAGYTPSGLKSKNSWETDKNLISHTSIKEKKMFYNSREEFQVKQLIELLSQENLPKVQSRLEQ